MVVAAGVVEAGTYVNPTGRREWEVDRLQAQLDRLAGSRSTGDEKLEGEELAGLRRHGRDRVTDALETRAQIIVTHSQDTGVGPTRTVMNASSS